MHLMDGRGASVLEQSKSANTIICTMKTLLLYYNVVTKDTQAFYVGGDNIQ